MCSLGSFMTSHHVSHASSSSVLMFIFLVLSGFPNDKMSRFSFQHHNLSHPMTLHLQMTLNHHFPIEGEYYMDHICYSSNLTLCHTKIFLPNRANWLEALVVMAWWSFGNQISISPLRIHVYLYSQRIACYFWKSCTTLKRKGFSQIYPESLYCHSENRQFHFHSLCQVRLSVSTANIVFKHTETFPQIFQYRHDSFSLD